MSVVINGAFVNVFNETLENGVTLIIDATNFPVSNCAVFYRDFLVILLGYTL